MHSTKMYFIFVPQYELIMEYTSHYNSTDFSYLAVLLLLAYFLSSAPKYVRTFREHHIDIKIEKVPPFKQVLKFGKYYTIDPYIRIWNRLTPSSTDNNLASNSTPVLR